MSDEARSDRVAAATLALELRRHGVKRETVYRALFEASQPVDTRGYDIFVRPSWSLPESDLWRIVGAAMDSPLPTVAESVVDRAFGEPSADARAVVEAVRVEEVLDP